MFKSIMMAILSEGGKTSLMLASSLTIQYSSVQGHLESSSSLLSQIDSQNVYSHTDLPETYYKSEKNGDIRFGDIEISSLDSGVEQIKADVQEIKQAEQKGQGNSIPKAQPFSPKGNLNKINKTTNNSINNSSLRISKVSKSITKSEVPKAISTDSSNPPENANESSLDQTSSTSSQLKVTKAKESDSQEESGSSDNGITTNQIVSAQGALSSTLNTTQIVSPTLDNVYLAAVSINDGSESVLGINGLGLSWQKLNEQCSNMDTIKTEIWYAIGDGTGTVGLITASLSNSVDSANLIVVEFENLDESSPFGSNASANPLGENINATCGLPGISTNHIEYSVSPLGHSGKLVTINSFQQNGNHYSGEGSTVLFQSSIDGNNLFISEMDFSLPGEIEIEGELDTSVRWSSLSVELMPRP
ncbi:MAG: hypothetical protein KC493_13860 [Bacteriovoracaceae bacterium]|nr:hypothetical protein [Bacteriovoracaceae bacterium]